MNEAKNGLRLEAKTAGCNEYVTKPFDPLILDVVIGRPLRRKVPS